MRTSCTVALFAICLITCGPLHAQDWPQFRGPSGNGVVDSLAHPETWSNDSNVAWSVALPGGGLSSPIITGDRVLVTSAVGANPPVSFSEGVRDMRPKLPEGNLKFTVTCLSLNDGSKIWEKVVAEKKPEFPIHGSNSFATESPATDGKHFFTYFAAIGVVTAYDLEGNELWRQDIGAYPTGNGFGSGSSLAIGDGMIFIQCDNDRKSFVVAFEATTGKEKWRAERSGRTSWATPLFWKNAKRSELITCGSGFVTSYEPATGKVLWKMDGISMSFSSSPAADNERIYFGNSGPRSSGPLLAVSADATGEQSFSADADLEGLTWSKMQAGPGMASPVAVGDYLYVPGRGVLTCYSAKSGEVLFKERLPLQSMAASLWAGKNRVFMMDENGKTVVLEPGDEMKIIATNQIDDLCWSTPAVSGNALLIRGVKKLYCIRK